MSELCIGGSKQGLQVTEIKTEHFTWIAGVALVTFLYVDFCDCTGTLFSMANYMNNYIPGEDSP